MFEARLESVNLLVNVTNEKTLAAVVGVGVWVERADGCGGRVFGFGYVEEVGVGARVKKLPNVVVVLADVDVGGLRDGDGLGVSLP